MYTLVARVNRAGSRHQYLQARRSPQTGQPDMVGLLCASYAWPRVSPPAVV